MILLFLCYCACCACSLLFARMILVAEGLLMACQPISTLTSHSVDPLRVDFLVSLLRNINTEKEQKYVGWQQLNLPCE